MSKPRNPLPHLTKEDRAAAAQKAIANRKKRALIKDKVRKREITIFDVLDMDDEVIKQMKVIDLLKAAPAIGETKAERLMRQVNIAQTRRLGGLGKHQRAMLEEIFQAKGW